MNHLTKIATLLILLIVYQHYNALAKPTEMKFGDIPLSDLQMKEYPEDPSAPAVILAEVKKGELLISNSLTLIMKNHVRLKILKNSGLSYANITIPASNNIQISNIKAATYILEGDKVIEKKVGRKNIVKYRRSDNDYEYKIILPQVQVGTIIEYSYEINAMNYIVPPQNYFQHEIPLRYGELYYDPTEFIVLKFFVNGDKKLFNSNNFQNLSEGRAFHFIVKDIPAFHPENLMPNTVDYLLSVEFEISDFKDNAVLYDITPTYGNIHVKLLQTKDYKEEINKSGFLEGYTKKILSETDNPIERVKKIHQFISNKILWDGYSNIFLSQPLKKTFKKERGNCADINFMLISMLKQAGIYSYPVILSTRENGKLNPYFCHFNKFNYVVAAAIVDGKTYLIDATEPLRPFNLLPFECLNDSGRGIDPIYHKWIPLRNDEKSQIVSYMTLKLNEKGTITGIIKNVYIGYEAFSKRTLFYIYKNKGYESKLKESNPNLNIDSLSFNNADSIDKPFEEIFYVNIKNGFQSIDSTLDNQKYILLNPLFLSDISQNYFVEKERKFPISFGCPQEIRRIISLQVPDNYELFEKSSNIKYVIPNNSGSFNYGLEQKGNIINLMMKMELKKYDYPETDYELLQNFFNKVSKKNNEIIVVKVK
jgi:hypothetical protein